MVAAFTAALIVAGCDETAGYTIEYYAIRRIEMTFIGIASLLLILQLFSPNNARKLLKRDMSESLVIMKDMLDDSFKRYKIMVDGSRGFINYKSEIINDHDDRNRYGHHKVGSKSVVEELDDHELHAEVEEAESKSDARMDLIQEEDKENYIIDIQDNVELEVMNDNMDYNLKTRESPDELHKKFQEKKLAVTKLLESEKMLINAAVFEPIFAQHVFNDELHFKLHDIQFWLLRRCVQINGCLRECLVYIEKPNETQWLLNTELIQDITPFASYLELFEKCHDVILVSMEYYIKQLNTKNYKQKDKDWCIGCINDFSSC